MPSTILDDVLVALEETAAESKGERCALLMTAHNMLVHRRSPWSGTRLAESERLAGDQPPGPIGPHEQVFVMPPLKPAAEVDSPLRIEGGPVHGAHMTLDEIYAKIPEVNCKGRCQKCCGPILCQKPEWDRVVLVGNVRPESEVPLPECPALTPRGKCSAYSVRPAICRLYGAVKKMRCPHGCRPKRWLSDQEAHAILEQIRLIDQRLAGPGLRMLEVAQQLGEHPTGAELRAAGITR